MKETESDKFSQKMKENGRKILMNEFAFHIGNVIGALSVDMIQEELCQRGFYTQEQTTLKELLGKLASTFYKE